MNVDQIKGLSVAIISTVMAYLVCLELLCTTALSKFLLATSWLAEGWYFFCMLMSVLIFVVWTMSGLLLGIHVSKIIRINRR